MEHKGLVGSFIFILILSILFASVNVNRNKELNNRIKEGTKILDSFRFDLMYSVIENNKGKITAKNIYNDVAFNIAIRNLIVKNNVLLKENETKFSGKEVLDTIKDILGNDYEYSHFNFIYDYNYEFKYDKNKDEYTYVKHLDHKPIENNYCDFVTDASKFDNKFRLKVKVLYYNDLNDNRIYYSDINLKNKLFTKNKDSLLKSNDINKGSIYNFVFNKIDGKYVFDSVTKKN